MITAYTDGGCWPNPGIGGWGAVVASDGEVKELYGGELESTNNRMELMGPIAALEFLPAGSKILIYCDSQYVVLGITKWIKGWKAKDWKKSGRKPVVNRELWERLDAACQRHTVRWQWIRGHTGIAGNERADELSRLGAEQTCGHPIDFAELVAA